MNFENCLLVLHEPCRHAKHVYKLSERIFKLNKSKYAYVYKLGHLLQYMLIFDMIPMDMVQNKLRKKTLTISAHIMANCLWEVTGHRFAISNILCFNMTIIRQRTLW